MILEHRCRVPVGVERLWEFMVDIPAVSRCLPGVEMFRPSGADEYRGIIRVRVGPIGLRLEGQITVRERDRERRVARMTAEARDTRILGGVMAKLTIHLIPVDDGETELIMHTDAAVLGKLGEFGQPIIGKSVDRMMQKFTENLERAIDNPNWASATAAPPS